MSNDGRLKTEAGAAQLDRLKRLSTYLQAARDDIVDLHEALDLLREQLTDRDGEIRRLRGEIEDWKDRYEAERIDHLATIEHCEAEMKRGGGG